MTDTAYIGRRSKRALILHDSFTFLVLGLSTLALFTVTLFLFRSFEARRLQLANRFAQQGREAFQQGRAKEAVTALETALEYKPEDSASQVLLAQALADAGETDQATTYFLNLWEARPGDGFLNLQLARLERKKGRRAEAIRYYRDSVFGDWRGDATVRRRDVRLELVDYLVQTNDVAAARAELLIAAGNAPDDLELTLMFADKLRQLGDTADALTYYRKVLSAHPKDARARASVAELEGEGH